MASNIPSPPSSPKVNVSVVDQAESSSSTQPPNMDNFSHEWTINNFSFCERIGQELRSSTFSARANDELRWCLKAYPGGKTEKSKNFLSLLVFLVSYNELKVTAKFEFSIINARREKVKTMKTRKVRKFVQGRFWGFLKFIKTDFLLDKANELLPDDKLTIFFQISVMMEKIKISWQNNTKLMTKFKRLKRQLPNNLDNLGLLLENQKFCDVTLTVCERKIQAHKAILAAQSPVFSAMFEHEMEERQKNQVNIIDMNYEVLEEMLRFIYTGKVVNLERIANDLLVAADKYALGKLKVMCEEALCTSLTIENVAEILILADFHSAYQLKAQAINFIITHADVKNTASFKFMMDSYPRLVAEAFCNLVILPVKTPKKRSKQS